ncbi:hypothetical protein B0H13DRAFT_2527411 [Mycena leptocephala]|nr:hypothetical protein B0H13DRAFT_2527411 [Mycena leptocephala]
MSGSGVTYYHEELKDLLRLLKHLPEGIPIGNDHNFVGYAPDGKRVDEVGCLKSVVAHDIGRSFGLRRTPAGEHIIISFKSRGPGLEEVVVVLRDYITGNGGPNVLLTQWVDDLRHAARVAIDTAGKCHDRGFMAFDGHSTDTCHGVCQALHAFLCSFVGVRNLSAFRGLRSVITRRSLPPCNREVF